ncbi:complement component C8 gamma chain isoform X1 [Bos taurus]|uniref:complement component C8 gamma chain isoform X1 n=1 Tax=Bos taurus TaxID=9913 RepID=UPI000572DCFC|nr:complement component C8 gamma chain isoform X1 [Bos taurus]
MECTVRRSLQARILGCLFLLQGIFPTQGSNPVLPRCRWTQSHLVDKDQRSTWTLDTGHGDRPLPGSTGPRSDVQGLSHGCQHLPKAGWNLLGSAAAVRRHGTPRALPAPSPGRPRAGGRGRRGHGLPRLCRLVPGEGAAAVGEAVRYVLGPWGPGLLRPQGCWVGWVGPLLPPACPCSSAQMWGQNGTGKRGSRGQIAARGTQPSPQSALQAPAPWVPRSPCVLHAVRSLPVSDSFLSVFEQRVQGANLTEDHTLFFPKYGFCEAADQFHTLDEVRR